MWLCVCSLPALLSNVLTLAFTFLISFHLDRSSSSTTLDIKVSLSAPASQETMLPDRPLEIPEITHLICSYLDNRDLATCVRASKSWHNLFLPYLWRTITLETVNGVYQPYPSYIYHYRHLIHDLTFPNGPLGYENFQYPNLRRLTISCDEHPQGRDISLDITTMFPSLIDLGLKHMNVSATTWSTLSSHHQCRTLELYSCELDVKSLPEFWRACKTLRSLELHSTTIAERGVPDGVVLSRISRLHVSHIKGWDSVSQLDLFLRCPHLKDMSWRAELSQNDPIHQQMSRLIRKEQWPHLEILDIDIELQDTDLAAMIEGAGNPSEIRFSSQGFNKHSFKQLSHHFGNLVNLDLWACLESTSPMVQDILCGCPRLEKLRVVELRANDIEQGRPWCCRQLRELHICIAIEEWEQDLHQIVFERLSELVQLESLLLAYPYESEDDHWSVLFRLDLGMGQLASLRQLKVLGILNEVAYHRVYLEIGTEEAEWIVENWENLKTIKGGLNSDNETDTKCGAILAEHGIDLDGFYAWLEVVSDSE